LRRSIQVRIYKVKDLDALGRTHKAVTAFESGKRLKQAIPAAPAGSKKRRAAA
jgi:dolichyl-diphosphooligosaccharide--protein glycosyltransferase